MPLILGQERLIPGFETNLVGLEVGGSTEFDITFPEDYGEPELAGQTVHFAVELRELREKVLPDLDDDFVHQMGDFDDLAALQAEIKTRLEGNALDKARHEFADKIIEYAVANATLELPDVLVDQEVEVMHDEFRGSIARQGITEEAYLKVTDKTDADLHAEFRPGAEKRVKVLLVLSKVAEAEGVEVPEADIEAEVAARPRPLRERPEARRLLRVGARPELHPQHAPAQPGRREARSTGGWRPIRSTRRCRTSRTRRRLARSRTSRRRPTPRSARPTPAPS